MRTRPKRIWAHLSEQEYAFFKKQIKRSGLSQEGYLRMLISGHVPRELPPLEYHRLIRQLLAIGNSLNQIAARANATGFFLADEYKKNAQELQKTLLEIKAEMTQPERM